MTSGEPVRNGKGSSGDRPSALTVVLRVGAGLLSVGLLVGVLWYALGQEDNRTAFKRLGEASALQIVGLGLLSFLGIVLNGMVFWLLILPVKRLELVGVIATNAIATFLASVPFKLSVMVRVAIHRKRDGVEFAYMGPWFAAIALALAASIGPLVAASTVESEITPRWFGLAGGLVLASWGLMVLAARFAAGGRGLRFVQAIGRRQPVRLIERALHTPFMTKLDDGLGMLCDPVTVAAVLVTRIVDMVGIAGRFLIAAAILGAPMDFGSALVYAIAYFSIGVVSPAGALGSREAGTAGIAVALAADEATGRLLTLVPIVVGGAELVVNAAAAGLSTIYIRPDKLLGAGEAESDPAGGDGDDGPGAAAAG